MTQEDYCSFEVAKLLKEKGFLKGIDLRTTQNLSFYDNIGLRHNLNRWYDSLIQDKIDFIVAPTHQMAMKWLRETHKLFIEIHIEQGEKVSYKFMIWDFHIIHPNKYTGGTYDFREEQKGFSTPEDAIEAALKCSLENLI